MATQTWNIRGEFVEVADRDEALVLIREAYHPHATIVGTDVFGTVARHTIGHPQAGAYAVDGVAIEYR